MLTVSTTAAAGPQGGLIENKWETAISPQHYFTTQFSKNTKHHSGAVAEVFVLAEANK